PNEFACEIIESIKPDIDQKIKLYPNPAKNILIFDPMVKENFYYSISDITNNIIQQNSSVNKTVINIEMLTPGIYLFQFKNESGSISESEMFVKN
ncbi:MAG: T9SS type A sorting domain-containing protein, partial [Chitinophagales bacterium]